MFRSRVQRLSGRGPRGLAGGSGVRPEVCQEKEVEGPEAQWRHLEIRQEVRVKGPEPHLCPLTRPLNLPDSGRASASLALPPGLVPRIASLRAPCHEPLGPAS